MTHDELVARALGTRYRKAFRILPIKCDDGKWRMCTTLRLEEVWMGRGWYRVGAVPALSL